METNFRNENPMNFQRAVILFARFVGIYFTGDDIKLLLGDLVIQGKSN